MSSPENQCVLSKQQQSKIQVLLDSANPDQILLACMLMETSGATPDDTRDLFSTSIVSKVVNTWDIAVWNAVALLLQHHESLCDSFRDFVEKRLAAKNSDFRRQFIKVLFDDLASPVVRLMRDCRFLRNLSSWEIKEIPTLPDAAFECLAKYHDALTLDGQLTLSDVAAEALVQHHGARLSLDDLATFPDAAAELSRTAAQTMARYQGTLTHGALSAVSDAVNALSNAANDLVDAANRVLSQYRATHLSLDGLSTLSDAAANSLSRYRGTSLSLGGLTTLSDAAAESLALYQGRLFISDVMSTGNKILTMRMVDNFFHDKNAAILAKCKFITFAAAEALAKYKGALHLDAVTSLSDPAAEVLAEHGNWLYLNGLIKLSDAAAKSLANHQGEHLYLDGLSELSDVAVESLSQHSGSYLFLNGLASLSDAAAESLAKYRGGLSLSEAAMKLVKAKRARIHAQDLNETATQ